MTVSLTRNSKSAPVNSKVEVGLNPPWWTRNSRRCTRTVRLAPLLVLLLAPVLAQQPPKRQFALRGETPEFWRLVDRSAHLEKFTGDFGFTEGPVWDRRGFLYLSDEVKNAVFRVFKGGRRETVIQLGDPDGNTYDQRHRLIVTASVLRAIIRMKRDGTYDVLADRYQGKRFNSPNDIVLGPDGALYFTDPTLDLPTGEKQEIPFQGVYRLGSDGSVRLLIRDLAQPNGLAFSPDGKRLYIDDSERRDIRVYDFHRDGTITNGREFGDEPGGKDEGVPDGMRVDLAGNVFVTGPLGIWVWDPAGHHLGTIVVPEQPANLTWGDPDNRTLYITATTSVYRLRTRARGFVPYDHR
jgi:gluconolactonase